MTIKTHLENFVSLAGCAALIGFVVAATPAAAAEREADVTFSKNVAPILQRSCENCHRPQGGAPMALISYQDVRPWARSIRNRTQSREMPPWFIDKNIGIQHYKNDPSLSNEEIETIAAWVDNGAPRGNPADLPPPIAWPADGWTYGTPDLIVPSPEGTVEADAPDWFGEWGHTPSGSGRGPLREGDRGQGSPSPRGAGGGGRRRPGRPGPVRRAPRGADCRAARRSGRAGGLRRPDVLRGAGRRVHPGARVGPERHGLSRRGRRPVACRVGDHVQLDASALDRPRGARPARRRLHAPSERTTNRNTSWAPPACAGRRTTTTSSTFRRTTTTCCGTGSTGWRSRPSC